ncbi:lipid droplet-associated hydrolase-like isoform X2 [Xenia sp. Carnegie-2017]|uniref:lipid droplet-associated hydrolase-like isoform X2 n=1 Tax=Xenia sp. Carnegie-2017 TaxID=2897299 RepID=UPI001F046981|nr:lipid droplet-associated hydrolase-like isoform X2 [Xenia sp. Carnegie-2017]
MADNVEIQESAESKVCKEVRNIDGIPTLISYACVESFDLKKCTKAVVVIPGNPGLVRFYDCFIASLFKACERRYPVFGIQHAGHGILKETSSFPNKSPFSLSQQINHKIAFLENIFSPSCKFVLIGHSIGAYIILKILEHFGKHQTRCTKGILLFPTIERMASSPNGIFATPVSKYFSWPLVLLTWWLSWLPLFIKRYLIDVWFNGRKVHSSCKEAVIELVNSSCVRNVLFMAADEMEEVNRTPVENRMRHAFVLESHEVMAQIAAAWID